MITLPRFPVPLPQDYDDLDRLNEDRSVSVCWACCLAEPVEGSPYRICGECGHVYQTEAILLSAYWRDRENPEHGRGYLTDPLPAEVFFCPECLHDF